MYLNFGKIRSARLSSDQKALLLVLLVVAALSAYRAIQLRTTSFYVSDEFRYVQDAVRGVYVDPLVSDRFLFTSINAALFGVLGIRTIDQFVLFLPLYLFLWSSVSVISFYKLMKLFDFDSRTIALSLFSLLFLVSFSLLALGFLSESCSLAFATLGTYFMAWYVRRGGRGAKSLVYPFISAIFYAAASFIREPFYGFLVGGMIVIAVEAISKRKKFGQLKRNQRIALVVLPIIIFTIPSLVLIRYPNDVVRQTFTSLNIQSTLTTHFSSSATVPSTTSPALNSSTGTTSTGPSSTGTTSTGPSSTGTTSTGPSSTGTTPVSSASANPPFNVLAPSQLSQTMYTFSLGLLLGWGPILVLIVAAGFFIALSRAIVKRDGTQLFIILVSLLAFGSYFIVLYVTSSSFFGTQNDFEFRFVSTIIRFSNTAVLAYFLIAPTAFSYVSKHRRATYAVVIALLLFGAFAFQIYPTYANSNLQLQGNPFSLEWRTGGATLRDYIASHPNDAPFYIVGFLPDTWFWTPETSTLNRSTVFLYNVTEDQFLAHRWTTFYVYGTTVQNVNASEGFLMPLAFPQLTQGVTGGQPYHLANREVVFNSSTYRAFLIRIQLTWSS